MRRDGPTGVRLAIRRLADGSALLVFAQAPTRAERELVTRTGGRALWRAVEALTGSPRRGAPETTRTSARAV